MTKTAPSATPPGNGRASRPAGLPRADPEDRFDGDALLGHAESILKSGRAKADQLEVYLERGADLDASIEKGMVASMGTGLASGGAVRVVVARRVGFAYFTRLEDAPRAIEDAVRQSRHAAAKGFMLPAGAKPNPLPGRWHADVAALDVPAAIAAAEAVLQGARERLPDASVSGGGVGCSASLAAIANSEGVAAWDRSTRFGIGASLVLEDGERSISAGEADSSHALDLDGHAVGVRAADLVASLRKPRQVTKGGRLDIILKPEGTSELLADLAVEAATGDEAMRGKTAWSGRLGQQVAASGLHLADDPWAPGAIGGVPFDDEGVPTRRLPILDSGVLRTFLFDAWDAHEHGQKTTASAGRGDFKSRPGTTTHHLVLSGPTKGLDRLVAAVDDGFLVESLLGAHTANATTGDFSVTSPNVWRIKGGAIEGACTDIALAGRLGDWLQKVEAVSTETKRMSGATLPHTLVRGVDVSV